MVDEWVKEMDELYARNIQPIKVTEITSFVDLVRIMVDKVLESPKLTEAQKKHTTDNVILYLAPALWNKAPHFKQLVIKNILGRLATEKGIEKERAERRLEALAPHFADYIEKLTSLDLETAKKELYKKYGANQPLVLQFLDRLGIYDLLKEQFTEAGKELVDRLMFRPLQLDEIW